MTDIDSTIIGTKRLMFGRYQLLSILGEGAVGAVYRVYDQELNCELALKVLTNDIPFDNHTLSRFKDEYWILKRISHPNLIKAYDLIEQDGQVAYSMEFIDGSDLCSHMNSGSIDASFALKIATDVLSALDTLHGFGLLHRDLKLENVIIDNTGVVKLCDLGLVKSLFKKSMTRTGLLLGTAQYMAPEYIKEGEFDARSDIYALGVMLFELLSGKRRLGHLQGNDVVRHLIKTNFTLPFIEIENDIDCRVLNIVKKAVNIDVEQRYQSAGAFMRDLQSWGDPEVVQDRIIAQQAPEVMLQSAKPNYLVYGLTVCLVLLSGIVSFSTLFNSNTVKVFNGSYKGNILVDNQYKSINIEIGDSDKFKSEWESCQEGEIDFQTNTLNCNQRIFTLSGFKANENILSFIVKEGTNSFAVETVRN